VLSKSEKEKLKAIGVKIRQLREKKDISQSQMAFEIKTSTRHYQRIEYGEINSGIISLHRIAEIFNVDVRDLIP
jgi:transcriptional regulator with XRE-family HTH domain